MPHSFHGSVHPDDHKAGTRGKRIEVMPAPERVTLPMSMHIGALCEPTVKPGSEVLLGQKIADSPSPVSAPIHASVSGKVLAVEPRPHPNGTRVLSVIVENDGRDERDPSIAPHGSYESLTPDELLGIIREAGIVGMGGATFPTHTKLRSSMGRVEHLIINGAECEPYLNADNRLMREAPEEVLGGTRVLMKLLGLSTATIAVESNKKESIDRLRRTLPRRGADIRVLALPTRYPQGAEKQLVRTVTGREIPPGALPSAVGACVFNVETAASIHRTVTTGFPLYSRVVTVSGSAVSNPRNLWVRLGTSFEDVFNASGGFRERPEKVIMGGPMMGLAQHTLAAPVTKGTSALLALTARDITASDRQICIRCGKCVSVCPMRLQPLYMYMYGEKGMMPELEKQRVTDCIECGCCSYTCPGRLYLVQSFRTGKQKLLDYKKAQAR